MEQNTTDLNDFEYNNEEEAEMGQLHAIHLGMNAVADVQRQLAEQARFPSLAHCEECGDDIPDARQRLMPGVRRCVYCQELSERR
jgi:phage/conjugal plasmid C-4 type zinc finger TraR family protein